MIRGKFCVDVYLKGEKYGEPGAFIITIFRKLKAKSIGNFNPMFCTYHKKERLVQSRIGDLSDPFRRTHEYLEDLFIEI